MNKQCFRFMFSKILQCLVVTLERAKSTDKLNKSESASGSILQKFCKFRLLVLSLFFIPNIGNTQDSNPTLVTAQSLGINTQIDNAHQTVSKPKDVDKVLEEQNTLREAMAQVSKAADTYSRRQADSLNKEADELAKQGKVQEATQKRNEAESWQTSGENKRKVEAVTTAITMATAGKPTETIAVGAASSYVNQAIKDITKESETANLATHVLWGAIEAELSGNKAQTGAIAAATAELGAKALTQAVYNKTPTELTPEEKATVLEISKAMAGVAVGATDGGNAASVVTSVKTAADVAESAVENNLLSLEKDEYVHQRNEEFNQKGYLEEKYKQKTKEYLLEDRYINYLLQKYQSDPNQLSYLERNYLTAELAKIAKSYDIPVENLYNWDFSNSIKRDDSKLSRSLIADDYFWNRSYEGKQAKSFAVGLATLPAAYSADKLVRFYPELAKGVVANPVLSETAVVVGYKSGELIGEGKVFVDGKFNRSGVEDIAKDGLKTLALGKLPLRQQIGYGLAIDYGYEVNKHNATNQSVTAETIGSGAGAAVSGIIGIGTNYLPRFNAASKILGNTILGDIASDKAKEKYKELGKQHRQEGNK